uniref:Uncharacterized protein n=1 Tax=Rhizophora mucronata TaxID=61149 RepID=A0A2P2P4T7_RHIMU
MNHLSRPSGHFKLTKFQKFQISFLGLYNLMKIKDDHTNAAR